MKILSIDTCTCSCSVALHEGDKLISEYFMNNGLTHSQTLMPIVKFLLKCNNISVKDINVFGLTNGPGSFTGLRIGMAAVKGMALMFDIKCAVVSSLHALALNMSFIDGIVCSCIDARNQQVYNAIFDSNGGNLKRITQDRAILISDLVEELDSYNKKIIFVGDAAEICYNNSREVINDKDLVLPSEDLRFIKASKIGEEAMRIYNSGLALSSEEVMPQYLKLPQAERELMARIKKGGDIR